jgi:lipopolysaccharide export system protein LptA
MKFLLGLILISLPGSGLLAQTISDSNPFGSESPVAAKASPASGPGKKATAAATPQGPTTIDSDSMDYDEKTRIAIFTGENYGVFVKDPTFTVYCDKMTAHMRKAGGAASPAPGAKSSPAPKTTPAPKGKPGGADAKGGAADANGGAADASSRSSGLQSALAEGSADRPVVIVKDEPATNGQAPQRDVGIALKADYNTDSGDVVLTGWPRVSQGMNTQIATSARTVMIMNRGSHHMRTIGPSRTVIQDQAKPAKTGTNAASAEPSPSVSPQ